MNLGPFMPDEDKNIHGSLDLMTCENDLFSLCGCGDYHAHLFQVPAFLVSNCKCNLIDLASLVTVGLLLIDFKY